MEFLRRHLGRKSSERGRQRPDNPAAGEAQVIREKKSAADMLKERIPHLSAVPPEEQWATITVNKEGKPTLVKVPFVESEVESIDAGYDSWLKVNNRGALNSGCERDFMSGGQFFPRVGDSPYPWYSTIEDRAGSVRGIVLAAIAAREILDIYPEGKRIAFSPSEESRADLELLAALPDQLLEHGDEIPSSDVPKVIFEKDQ